MGLVPRPHLAWAAISVRPAPLKACEDFIAQLPMLFHPVISMAKKVPWRRQRAYSRTGTVVNRLSCKEALEGVEGGLLEIAPARCVLNAALKGRYHHADGKEGPAQLGEKRTTDRTQERSNSSTPMFPIWAKKAPRKPTIWL